jgi:opacity protein-like surface antigen
MVSVKVTAFAGIAVLMTSAAHAADMPYPMPPIPVPYYEEFAKGWYLRGDIGMSNQKVDSLFNALYDTVDRVETVHKEFDSAPFFGLGIGYQFNHWFRADLTGEYRGGATFHGYDIVTAGGSMFTDEYRAIKSEWLVLANIYADLGTWGGFTPFLGLGIGGSRNTISSFIDVCTTCPGGGVAHGPTATKTNFAWAFHAGLGYKVTNNVTIEFAYRYVDLGDALSGDLQTYLGGNSVNNPMHFRNITSHDFKFGVRWLLDAGPVYKEAYHYPPPPKYHYPPPPPRQHYPAPSYSPPPSYPPPPSYAPPPGYSQNYPPPGYSQSYPPPSYSQAYPPPIRRG